MAEAVLEAKIHVVEHQLRRAAQLVRPCHQRVGNDDARLAQQPVGEARVVILPVRIDFDAGQMQAPVHVAANGKLRAVDGQLLQPQVQERHRRPRHHEIDAREIDQRRIGGMLAIVNLQAADSQPRIPAIPAGIDGDNCHRLSQFRGQRGHDPLAVFVDPRKHDQADDQQQYAKRRERRYGGNAQEAENAGGARVQKVEPKEGLAPDGHNVRQGRRIVAEGPDRPAQDLGPWKPLRLVSMDIIHALAFSRYASRALGAEPELAAFVSATRERPFVWNDVGATLAAVDDPEALAIALRKLRRRVFLHTLARDLAGLAPLTEVCGAMTQLAELASAPPLPCMRGCWPKAMASHWARTTGHPSP